MAPGRILAALTIYMVLAAACGRTATQTAVPATLESPKATATPVESGERRCGDGVCDGPETAESCPDDCGAGGSAPVPSALWVTNPTGGARLFVRVVLPTDAVAAPYPALILVPGGSGAGSSFLRATERMSSDAQRMADAGPFAVVVFDPDGRGHSDGTENDDGYVHQDGLAAVIRFAASLPEVDATRLGLVSYSYGVTMATGALARHPDLPVLFLIDKEGPANRDDTGGCDADNVGHLKNHGCDNGPFWAEREAATFAHEVRVPYQRLQSRNDHAQPDLDHALLMMANSTDSAHGGDGVAPWTRLNRLEPNTVWTSETLPELPPPGSSEVQDIPAYARALLDLFAPSTAGAGDPPHDAPAPLYLTTMTHMERNFVDDKDRDVFLRHVALLRSGLALANEYGARLTVETEMPFARACNKWSINAMQEVLDLGHGVGTHSDVGFNNPPPSVAAFAAELSERKALVDALVGPENNRGTSGAGSHLDWVLAAHQAGFLYVDGVVGMHYLSMPIEARPDATWTDAFIRREGYHDAAPVDLADRIHPFLVRDATDFEPDADGVILVSSGETSRLDAMAEGDPRACGRDACTFDAADTEAFVGIIEQARSVHDPTRIAKLTLYIPVDLFQQQHEASWRTFYARMQDLARQGAITWATQGEVYDAYIAWNAD